MENLTTVLQAHQEQMKQQSEYFSRLLVNQQEQIKILTQQFSTSKLTSAITTFTPFQPESESWKDYFERFNTFSKANSISEKQVTHVFLTSQTKNI